VGRAEAFNVLARPKGFRYPNYEAGFFVTVFTDDAPRKAARMREDGVFVVAQEGALRVALCATATADIPRLVAALEKAGA
jgi:aromatic-amino-acid transaminase